MNWEQILAVVLLAASLLGASEHNGQVKFGGLPVPGATVTASQGDKKFVAVTDQRGVYSFRNLPDGDWAIQVEMLCFATIKQEVKIAPNVPFSPQWDLKMLPFDDIKAVAGPMAPPAPPSVEAKEASVAPTPAPVPSIKAKAATAPPPARSPSGFQRADVNATNQNATPGSDADKPAEPGSTTPDEASPNISGDGFLVNGSVNNGAASPFAQSAAFGNNRRGGRSLYNGSLGFVLGNSAFDARSFSLTGQETAKPGYNRIQGMAAFGGPLKIPHLLRNGPNVSVNYQWVRNRNANTQSALMPASAARSGDFSGAAPIFDPETRMQFPGNVIPQGRISPQAKALLPLFPMPNFGATSRYNYQIPVLGVTHQDNLQARFMKAANIKNQLSGSFAYQNTRSDSQSIFNFLDKTNSTGINSTFTWFRRFSQRLFANFGVQYSRSSARAIPFFANRQNISGDAGITGNDQDPLNWGPPRLSFSSGIQGLSDGQSAFNRSQTAGLSAGLFWNRSSHNVRLGGDFRRQQFNNLSQQNPRGTFTFTGAATGSDFAGFLLGIPDTSAIAFGNADKYLRSSTYDAYVQDDWRMNPSFTINGGIRWEYSSPITELQGRLVNLDIAPGFTTVAPVVASNGAGPLTGQKYPQSLVQPDKHGIQPRVGIAWRPFPASSMIVRAGYGVTYNTSVYQSIATQMAQQSPISKSLSVSNTPATPLTLAKGFDTPPGTTNTFAIDPNFRVGYAQSWNASIQRDLPRSLMMTATYLGIKGTRAAQQFYPNTYPAGAVNPCPACPSGYAYMTSNGNSTRNAGTLQLRRRLHNGFTATLNYTYSKSIDDAALGGHGQANLTAQNWLNLSAERGLSSFDQRHLLSLETQYSTGVGVSGGTLLDGWMGRLIKDWTITSQLTAGSGLPETPIYFAAVKGTGFTGNLRPQYTGAPLYNAPSGLSLNPAAYAAPPAGQWGNAGRNSITGPAHFSLNASMSRTFRLSDRLNGDLRIDATNALNHVTFSAWNTTVGNSQFGLPNAANGMRRLQTTLRVRF